LEYLTKPDLVRQMNAGLENSTAEMNVRLRRRQPTPLDLKQAKHEAASMSTIPAI
jgi:hypothetical protein